MWGELSDQTKRALSILLILPSIWVTLPYVLAGQTHLSAFTLEQRTIIFVSVLASLAVAYGPAKRRYGESYTVEVDDDEW